MVILLVQILWTVIDASKRRLYPKTSIVSIRHGKRVGSRFQPHDYVLPGFKSIENGCDLGDIDCVLTHIVSDDDGFRHH
jgi:hypothetical protein